MDHPFLTDLLTRACRRRHLSVVVQPTIREGLSWLREQARPLQAIVLDEAVLSLDLEMVIHALWEYLPEPPLIIVCGMHLPATETLRASSSVVHLSHPFALAHLLHVLAGP
jgi:DNA-binding response OmpR family regulator